MRNSSWIFLSFLLFTACHSAEKKETPDFLTENIDTTVNPATDFFSYANGEWLKKNPIPPDQSRWGIGSLVQLDIYDRLRIINEKAVAVQSAPGSIAQKIGDFWYSGMDSAEIEKQGLQPLKPNLDKIERISSLEDVLRVTAELGKIGVDALMGGGIAQDEKKSDQMAVYLEQGGLGMPNREYYFNTDKRSEEVRKAYHSYLYNSFRSLGKDSSGAVAAANAVYEFETGLAKVSRKIENLRDPESNYHKMNLGLIQK